jgi:hypothetical protein
MRRTLTLLFAITLFVLPSFAAKQKNWETAKVISQEFDAIGGSAVTMPRGTMHAAFPLTRTRHYSIVVVETAKSRMTWSESGKHPITLMVNGSIQFYRDGDRFVVLDFQQKKHKFVLIGMSTPGKSPIAPEPR